MFNKENLQNEINYFHHSFFKMPPSQDISDHYINAHNHVFQNYSAIQLIIIEKIISNKLDLLSVELVLRRVQPDNIITKKMQIMLYLTEARREYNDIFINEQNSFFKAFFIMTGVACKTVFRYIKGVFLIWRFNLV